MLSSLSGQKACFQEHCNYHLSIMDAGATKNDAHLPTRIHTLYGNCVVQKARILHTWTLGICMICHQSPVPVRVSSPDYGEGKGALTSGKQKQHRTDLPQASVAGEDGGGGLHKHTWAEAICPNWGIHHGLIGLWGFLS